MTAPDWADAEAAKLFGKYDVAAALRLARARGQEDARAWHGKHAKLMSALVEDGVTGRVGADVAAKAAKHKEWHDYCASWCCVQKTREAIAV